MDEATFWALGEPDGTCLIWPRSGNQGGYGHAWYGGRLWQVHRLAYSLRWGDIPDGMCVLHYCDVRRCYNPDHLWLGTRGDNNTDRSVKGRTARLHGASNRNARLTADQADAVAREYRPRYATCPGPNGSTRWRSNANELTEAYGISRTVLYRILRGETYASRA